MQFLRNMSLVAAVSMVMVRLEMVGIDNGERNRGSGRGRAMRN